MANKDRSTRIKKIIKKIQYATIATVSDSGELLNTPVYFAYDKNYNIYWGSHQYSTHSQNIRSNGQAFIVIYDSTVIPGTGEGVYIKVQCHELSEQDKVNAAYELIKKRRHPIPYWNLENFGKDQPIRLYVATPIDFSTNDEVEINGIIIDQRTKVII